MMNPKLVRLSIDPSMVYQCSDRIISECSPAEPLSFFRNVEKMEFNSLSWAVLVEPPVLFYLVNGDFMFSATIVADTSFLDVSKPVCAVTIGIGAEGFKNDELTIAILTFLGHS